MPLFKHTLEGLGSLASGCAFENVTLTYAGVAGSSREDVLPWLLLPSIRTLTLNVFSPGRNFHISVPLVNSYSGLRELAIHECDAAAEEFADLLAICPNLCSLCIKWPNRAYNGSRYDWNWFGDALRLLPQLRVLHFDHQPRETLEYTVSDGSDPALPMGPLVVLNNLRSVQISSMALFGGGDYNPGVFGSAVEDGHSEQKAALATLLPKSVRHLTVLYQGGHLTNSIRSLRHDPFVDDLESFKIYSCYKEHWIYKDGSEHYVPRSRPVSSNKNLDLDASVDAVESV